MAKQSVKQGRSRSGKVVFYTPKRLADRKLIMQLSLKSQLPCGFQPIETPVTICKLHFVSSPPKSMPKNILQKVANNEIVFKFTRPDLPDNLKKLVIDSMTGIVFKDDSLIVAEDDVKKYYGLRPQTIIELEYGHIDSKGCEILGV